jgi:hypothetical protein
MDCASQSVAVHIAGKHNISKDQIYLRLALQHVQSRFGIFRLKHSQANGLQLPYDDGAQLRIILDNKNRFFIRVVRLQRGRVHKSRL